MSYCLELTERKRKVGVIKKINVVPFSQQTKSKEGSKCVEPNKSYM